MMENLENKENSVPVGHIKLQNHLGYIKEIEISEKRKKKE